MGTVELISWLSLGIGFAGPWEIFTTRRALRKIGRRAMSTGLAVFCLAGPSAVL